MSRRLERIPEELEARILDGQDVRTSLSDPLAGLCGGIVARSNGSESTSSAFGGEFCTRPAGFGTDHLGYGRCMHHPEGSEGQEKALAPWCGPLTDDEWKAVLGVDGDPSERHGARHLLVLRKSWEQWLGEAIPPEELEAYRTMPTDPITVLDQDIKLNRLMMARRLRWVRLRRMQADMNPYGLGGGDYDVQIQQAEAQIQKLSITLARLMEVRARISEVASAAKTGEALEDLLRGLSDEDFTRASSAGEGRLIQFLNDRASGA